MAPVFVKLSASRRGSPKRVKCRETCPSLVSAEKGTNQRQTEGLGIKERMIPKVKEEDRPMYFLKEKKKEQEQKH